MSETLGMIAFGPFRLDADRRQLTCNGVPVTLSSRGFDILSLLAENRGRVVSKDEIMSHVWRGMIVEENNLAVQISALRRALAQGVHAQGRALAQGAQAQASQAQAEDLQIGGSSAYESGGEAPVILTVPGHGYRFVARLHREADGPRGNALPATPADTPAAAQAPTPVAIPPTPHAAPHAAHTPQAAPPHAGLQAPLWRSPVVMAALAACVVALAGFELLRPAPPPPRAAQVLPPPPRLSVAVLPFRDLSDDRCCDYLADAISDDLTTELSLMPGSVVIARESADMFRNHPAPADAIGRSLHVRYLVEGSLRSVEGIFSINAQLIEAATGAHLWAERFTVPRAHLAEAQNAIVQRLASALGVKLVAIEGARSLQDHPENPDAMDLFLRARSVLDRSDTLDAMNQAQGFLEQALAKAPDDIDALGELGWLLPRKNTNFVTVHREADMAEARRVAAHAAALQPANPVVLSAQAALQLFDDDCTGAQRTFQAALDAQPNAVRALTGLAVCKFKLGHFADAMTDLAALLRIDPESPREKMRAYQMGFSALMLGDPKAALPWLYKSTAGEPLPAIGSTDTGSSWKRLALIAALRLSGDRAASDALFSQYRSVWPNRSTWALEARSPAAFSAVPGFRHFLAALQDRRIAAFRG